MSSSELDRDPLEVLFSEFVDRIREGENIDISKFAEEHPENAEEILELFPTLAALEKVRIEKQDSLHVIDEQGIDSGTQLGDYRLIREIGIGGMGIVYEATQQSMQRRVALKVLPREFGRQADRRERFTHEAKTVARLSYRNIVPIIDFGESNGRCYFAMRLIEGVGLDWVVLRRSQDPSPLTSHEVFDQFMQQGVPLTDREGSEDVDEDSLAFDVKAAARENGKAEEQNAKWVLKKDSWKQIARIGIQAARALGHAHNFGVLHRDIKPGNLLLDYEGVIWVTDFGLAKTEQDLSLTGANDVVGTMRYISPERFHGQLDARSDLYALGLTLMELCTNRPAFPQSNRSELIRTILEGDIIRPRSLNPAIPAELESILMKATAKQPTQRYQSAQEMIEDLRSFAHGQEVAAHTQFPLPQKTRKGSWWHVALALLGVVLFEGYLLFNYHHFFPGDYSATSVLSWQEDSMAERMQSLERLFQQITGSSFSDYQSEGSATTLSSNDQSELRIILSMALQLQEDARRINNQQVISKLEKQIVTLREILE